MSRLKFRGKYSMHTIQSQFPILYATQAGCERARNIDLRGRLDVAYRPLLGGGSWHYHRTRL